VREVTYQQIVSAVKELCIKANYDLGSDVVDAFKNALNEEKSEIGKDVLNQLILNADIASSKNVPSCQDTGVAVFMVELGQDCHIVGGNLYNAINEGIRQGYRDGYLRCSVIQNPLQRNNTGDNTPGVVHIELVEGDKCTIHMTAKGFGGENMSRLQMMKPSDGIEGAKQFIIETVKLAGPNACPPMVVGVGLGGTFEKAALLAKKSLFRPIGQRSKHQDVAELEVELIEEINKLGIGPQGMGGSTTALDVHIEIYATHIAALPVAVNLNCHASRFKMTVL
jgi:fumarate hydratase subunit alpha